MHRYLDADLQRQEAARAIFRPCMKIAAGGGDARVSQSGLYQVYGSSAIKGVGGMRVPEPVRRDRKLDSGALSGLTDKAEHSCRTQEAAAFRFARAEYGVVRGGMAGSQSIQKLPNRGRKLRSPGDSAFAEYGDLATITDRLQVPPAKAAEFADANSGGI